MASVIFDSNGNDRQRVIVGGVERMMTFEEFFVEVVRADEGVVTLPVDGWKTPWTCSFGEDGNVRAQCPTAPRVRPIVERDPERGQFERSTNASVRE